MRIKKDKSKFVYGVILYIYSLVVRFASFYILPKKYFYDSETIQNMVTTNQVADKSYNFAANFFKSINILGLSSIQSWGLLISLVVSPIIIIWWLKRKPSLKNMNIFFIMSLTLLNIYVFGITKDLIQFIYFFIIAIILSNKGYSNRKKIILISIILMLEALNFRIYYAIMAILAITLYILYSIFINNNRKNKFRNFIILSFISFFIEIFIISIINTNNYNSIIHARYSVNIWRTNSLDAATIINDPLGTNSNLLIFIGNYIINAIRMILPFELIFKGVKYIPFIIFQILYIYVIIKAWSNKERRKANILSIIMVISFMMVSIIFEPDFGSWIRHEAATLPVLVTLMGSTNSNRTKEKKKC